MEESLKQWAEMVCRDLLGEQDADCNLFEDNLLLVGRMLTRPQSESDHPGQQLSFETLHRLAARALNLREDVVTLEATAMIFLKFAVSSECSRKSELVSHIISMDQSLQEKLMEAIQDQSLVIDDDDEGCHQSDESFVDQSVIESENDDINSTSKDESRLISCDNCHKMEEQIKNYETQISHLLDRENTLEKRLKEDSVTYQNDNMDLQDAIREKDVELRDLKQKLQSVQDSSTELVEKLSQYDALNDTVCSLRDEIDILMPYKRRAEQSEDQIARLLEKLDKLDCVKDQLRSEVECHHATQDELTALRAELDTLRNANSQVIEYRDRCTEYVIEIKDLKAQLIKSNEDREELRHKILMLSEGREEVEVYNKSLVDELKVASEALRNSERESGIGSGISELNPEVSRELNKLRAENTELANKLEKTSVEFLDKLQQDLMDQESINASLQEKWSKSKDSIALLTKNIVGLETTVNDLSEKLLTETMKYNETCAMAEEDKVSLVVRHDKKIAFIEKRHEHHMFLVSTGQKTTLDGLQQEFNATHSSLHKYLRDLKYETMERKGVEQRLQEKETELANVTNKRKREYDQYSQAKADMQIEFETAKSAMENRHRLSEEEIREKFKLQLDSERSKNFNLAADIEEEKLKRRKLEREKRFHEAESHRYKSQMQMQCNSNASNVDVDSVLKEMKMMQDQLDAAKRQVNDLQSQAKAAGHDSGYHDTSDGHSKLLHSNAQRVNPRGGNMTSYLEQTEMYERKIEQMTRERREMIAKNLEENKERVELNQKLLQSEKETSLYKSKVTKLTLEKERLSRQLSKALDTENIPPAAPRSVPQL